MRPRFLRALTTPGALMPGRVLGVSLLLMLVVFLCDVLTPTAIRLHVLYIFPLAAIALHYRDGRALAAGLALSVALQWLTFIVHRVPLDSMLTDAMVALATSVLTILLAREVRDNYLSVSQLAEKDSLTGLNNRRSFELVTQREMIRQLRYKGAFSIVMVDLDQFKELNDSAGHAAGDKVLKVVAHVLLEHTREADVVSRYGGDEFAILMPSTDAATCKAVCAQLTAEIDQRMLAAGCPVTASIGFASFARPPESLAVALDQADRAMYQVKEGRRNGA